MDNVTAEGSPEDYNILLKATINAHKVLKWNGREKCDEKFSTLIIITCLAEAQAAIS